MLLVKSLLSRCRVRELVCGNEDGELVLIVRQEFIGFCEL
jgi:hypothetical protein